METYNELLRQFHESTAPKDFLTNYKSLLDELQLNRTRRKQQFLLKTAQLKHLHPQQTHSIAISSASLSIMDDSRVACSRLESECAGQRQLRQEQAELQREIEALKAKTLELTSELSIYRNREELVSEANVGSSFGVFRQWKQVGQEVNIIDREEARQQEILHDLKARKQHLAEEIQQLIKNKQATDQLLKRWKKSKQARMKTVKQPQGQADLHGILRTFHFLNGLADQYQNNTGVSAEQLKMRFDWQEGFRGGRGDLLNFYLEKGPYYNDAAASKLISLYRKLEVELDRKERAHQQATETLNTLEASHDKLNCSLRKIHQRKERCTIHALRKYCQDIEALEDKLALNCARITKLTTSLHELLRRVSGFFKAVQRVMEQTEVGKRLVRELPDCEVLVRFEELLFRNPEEQLLGWSNHQLYTQVSSNSLLRLYASPTSLEPSLDVLDNYEKIAVVAFKKAQDFPAEMIQLLAQYMRIATVGSSPIPAEQDEYLQSKNYCVQSKEYYRRDNFKLLERLESEQLKRKGLLIRIPINLLADTEMNQCSLPVKPFASTRSLTPRNSFFSRETFKYTEVASKRQQQSLRKQKIRKLFGKLDSLSRSANRLVPNPLNCSRVSTKLNCSTMSSLHERLRQQRSTVGVVSKASFKNEGLE